MGFDVTTIWQPKRHEIEVVQLYVGDEDSSVMTGQDSVCLGKGCKVEEFMVWNVADCVEEDAIEVYSKPVPKLLHTSKWWLGAAFLSSCSVKLRTAPLATSMKFVGGALSVATPIVLVQQASIVPTIPPLSLSAIYWNLPTVGAALHWLSAAVTVPNMVMAATAYIMVKASIGFLRRGKSVPVGSGRPIYYIAAAVTATTACGYLGQLFSLFPVFTGTSLFGHHMVSLIPVKYAEWFTSSSLMLVNAGFMSGAGLKAVVPAIVANAIWVGGELGSVFLTSPLWAKVGLYSMSLGLGVVPLIWYIGYRLRDISKSYGDRELAGRFRLIADLTVVTWSLYPLAWLLSDGLGLMNMTSSSYVIMMSGLDILSKYGSGVLATKDHQVLSRAYSIATGDSGGKNRTRRVDPVPEGSVTEQAVYTETPPLLGEMATAALQSEGQAGDRSESSDDAIEEEE